MQNAKNKAVQEEADRILKQTKEEVATDRDQAKHQEISAKLKEAAK